ncbi:MAG: hypothetical protein R3B40_17080 [Polyangiales bacterium]
MSREAPPREAPVPTPDAPAPERTPHSVIWLMLPLLALGLPFAHRLATGTRVNRLFELGFRPRMLEDVWLASALVGALVLVGCMAARRRGRHVWAALDVVAGSLPWFVSLAAQSTSSQARSPFHPTDLALWGEEDAVPALWQTFVMHEVRGLGALMSACLWAAAALGWLVSRVDRPRPRGAALVVATLPVWGVVYGFPAEAGALPALAAAFLSSVVAFAGTQHSAPAREGARMAIVLATLTVLASWVTTVCHTLVGLQTVERAALIGHHALIFGTLSAARLGAVVALLPAALAMRWLLRPGDPRIPWPANLALIVAFVGVLGMDRVGTRLSLARGVPRPWPPWAEVEVTPLPVGDAWPNGERRFARFILDDEGVRDASGQLLARYSDSETLARVLTTAPLAWSTSPDGDGTMLPGEVDLSERLAIVPVSDVAQQQPLCPGRVVRVLVDRAMRMQDLRTFVRAATDAGVVELDVVGPRALDGATKRALQQALEASGVDGAFPFGGDELSYIAAVSALPPTGVPALDVVRVELGGGTGLLPCPCWRAQVWGTDQATEAVPADDRLLGEQLNEAPPDERWRAAPVAPTTLWLDPDRDVTSFVLEATTRHPRGRSVMWTLEPPAP